MDTAEIEVLAVVVGLVVLRLDGYVPITIRSEPMQTARTGRIFGLAIVDGRERHLISSHHLRRDAMSFR